MLIYNFYNSSKQNNTLMHSIPSTPPLAIYCSGDGSFAYRQQLHLRRLPLPLSNSAP